MFKSRNIAGAPHNRYIVYHAIITDYSNKSTTVHTFIELVKYLLKQPHVVYVLSAKLSQDCVESFFGKQRMRGGYCENPNVSSFISGAQSLRVQSSTAIQPLRGNCRLRVVDDVCIDDRPLPKRKRISKKK